MSLKIRRSLCEDDALYLPAAMLSFLVNLFAYLIILASLAFASYFIMKLLGLLEGATENMENLGPTETNPLIRQGKTVAVTCYGTCGEDLETGNCMNSSSTSTSSSSSSSSNSSGDLYDGKVCVICYDNQRNCFFVPCGHCAACYVCAQRIFNVESKVCPVCRRIIGKVRKL